MNKNIFISCIEVGEAIWDRLSQEGFEPWVYIKNGSLNWKKEIVKELGLASEYQKEIISFMIDAIPPHEITNAAIENDIVGGSRTWIEKKEPIKKQIDKLFGRMQSLLNSTINENGIGLHNKETKETIKPTNTGYIEARNLGASIDNLNDKFFNEGENIIIRGEVSADNLDTYYGQVTVIIDENVSLKLHRISWQKTGCKSTKYETKLSVNYNDLFAKGGLLLGDVPKDDDSYYNGDLIVEYKIKK